MPSTPQDFTPEIAEFDATSDAVDSFRLKVAELEPLRDEDPGLFQRLWDGAREAALGPVRAWSDGGKAVGEAMRGDIEAKASEDPFTLQDISDFASGFLADPGSAAEGKSNPYAWGREAAKMTGVDDRAKYREFFRRIAEGGELSEQELADFTDIMLMMVPATTALPGRAAASKGLQAFAPTKPTAAGQKVSPASTEAANNVLGRSPAQVKATMEAMGFDQNKPLVEVSERMNAAADAVGAEIMAREASNMLPLGMPVPVGDRVANINLARISAPEDILAVIKAGAEAMPDEIRAATRDSTGAGGKGVSWKTTIAEAMGVSEDRIVNRGIGDALSAKELLFAGNMITSGAENVRNLAIKAFGPTGTEADRAAFKIAASTQALIQSQFAGGVAEAGRALNALKIAKQSTAHAQQAMGEILALADEATTRELATYIASLPNATSINKFIRESQKATASDVLFTIYVNALLSNPKTHVANSIGNSATTMLQLPERAVAAGFSKLTGSDAVKIQEVGAQAHGLIEGFKDGLKAAAQVMRTGSAASVFTPIEGRANAISAQSLDLTGAYGRAADAFGKIVSTPSNALEASDAFFKAMNYRAELNALAVRTALDEASAGSTVPLGQRIQEILSDPPVQLHLDAVDWAKYQTFQKGLGKAGSMAMGLREAIPGAKIVVPFMRTPVNIMKYTGERTPLALLSPAVWRDLRAGGAAREMALSKMSVGSMILATGAYYASQGRITGSGPTNPIERAQWEKAGNLQYSVRIGDEWYSYSRFDPYGSILGLAGDIHDIIMYTDTKKDADLAAAAGALALIRTAASKTWIMGTVDMLEILDRNAPVEGVAKYFRKLGAGFVTPGLSSEIERNVDPTIRDTYSLLDQIKARTPGLSKDLPARRGIFGETTSVPESWGPNWLVPVATKSAAGDPPYAELLRLRLPLEKASKIMHMGGGSVELDPQKYEQLLRLAGNEAKNDDGMGFKDSFEALLNGTHPESQSYAEATDGPDGGKALIIRRLQRGYMEAAKARMLADDLDLQEAWKENMRAKARSMGARE